MYNVLKAFYEDLREAERKGVTLGELVTKFELEFPELRDTDAALENLFEKDLCRQCSTVDHDICTLDLNTTCLCCKETLAAMSEGQA